MKKDSNATDANVATIEEDIEILEKFSNENIMYGNTVGIILEKYKKLQVATQHILLDYARLQKENKQQQELIDKMKKFLLKENKMCDFLEGESKL